MKSITIANKAVQTVATTIPVPPSPAPATRILLSASPSAKSRYICLKARNAAGGGGGTCYIGTANTVTATNFYYTAVVAGNFSTEIFGEKYLGELWAITSAGGNIDIKILAVEER